MVMTPRTHPRGAPPDFSMVGLPPNPNPKRITNALWWLRCMRLRLEPLSADGGILAIKPGYHSYGSRLPGAGPGGAGKATTDHSIRRTADRTGAWWEDFAAAHDWTFNRAHTGNYTEIRLYTGRLVRSMQDPDDTRPDDVYAYTIGQIDGDRAVEGWNEYKDEPESGDDSHLWHRHDSFRRNIVGDFWAMWKALTIDMGWTFAEWRRSIEEKGQVDMNAAETTAWARGAGKDAIFDAWSQGLVGRSGVSAAVMLQRASDGVTVLQHAAQAEAARDAQTAAILAGMQTALSSLAAASGALTPEQVAALTEQVRQAAQVAGAEAVSVLAEQVASLRDHLGDDPV